MTKLELITRVGERLGDTSADFLTILGRVFEDVLAELAANDCIKSLRKTATFTFTANTMNYDTRVITGLAAGHYPMDIISLRIPSWQYAAKLERFSEADFDNWRSIYTDSVGVAIPGAPKGWRLYPNDQQLQVIPVPRAQDVITNGVEILYLKPPAALASGDTITEIRDEHIPALIAGMRKHGLVFQTETLQDLPDAIREFENWKIRMRGEAQRERGRAIRTRYRDF